METTTREAIREGTPTPDLDADTEPARVATPCRLSRVQYRGREAIGLGMDLRMSSSTI